MLIAMRAMIDRLYLTIRRVGITRRLMSIVFALLAFGLLLTLGQQFTMSRHREYLRYMEEERLPVDRLVQEAALEIASSQIVLIGYVEDQGPSVLDVDAHIQRAGNALTEAELTITDQVRRRQIQALKGKLELYSKSVSALETAKLTGDQNKIALHSVESQFHGNALRDEAQDIVMGSATQAEVEVQSAIDDFRRNTLIGGVAFLLLSVVLALGTYLVARSVLRPIHEIQQATRRMERGEWEQLLPERAADELGDLARSFNEMVHTIQNAQAEQAAWNQQLEEKVRLRTRELGQMVEQQEQLLATMRDMSVPVIPVLERIIILPLVGVVDSQRATQVVEGLLQGIESHQARIALVDITGVPVVDTHVAGTLLLAAQAAHLLGCQVVLVGIRPEVAQTLVGLGVDLGGIVTWADLQSGVEYALRVIGSDA